MLHNGPGSADGHATGRYKLHYRDKLFTTIYKLL